MKTDDPEVLNAQEVSTVQSVAGLASPEYVPVNVIEPVTPLITFVTEASKTVAERFIVDIVTLSGGMNFTEVFFFEGVTDDPVA